MNTENKNTFADTLIDGIMGTSLSSDHFIDFIDMVLSDEDTPQMIRDGLRAMDDKDDFSYLRRGGFLLKTHIAIESDRIDVIDSQPAAEIAHCHKDNILFVLTDLVRAHASNSYTHGEPDESCYDDPFPLKYDADSNRIPPFISAPGRLGLNPEYDTATDVRYLRKLKRPIYAVSVGVRFVKPENYLRSLMVAVDLVTSPHSNEQT